MTEATDKRNVDTFILENRIFCEMLATGETWELTPEDFRAEELALMWRVAIEAKEENNGMLDYVLLGDYTLRNYNVDKRGWLEAKHEQRLGTQNIIAYVRSLKEHRHARDLKRTLSDCMTDTGNAGEVREKAIAALKSLTISGKHRLLNVRTVVNSVIDEMESRLKSEGLPGVPSGIPNFDARTGGWQKSDLIILGARPGVGKTALMICLALEAAHRGHKVGIVSAEQPAEQLMQRMISQESGVPAWKLRNPRMILDREWSEIPKASAVLSELPIKIFDASAPTIADVRVAASELDVDVLFVDYIQRLKGNGHGSYERISSLALGLKELARDMKIPVVALAQINRAGIEGASMAHLKGSGDLEQEADIVAILERPENAESATLNIDKNRHGPIGMVNLYFCPDTMKFSQLER